MKPEILRPGEEPSVPRTSVGRGVFTDENLDVLSRVLDECFRIPGTQIRFGIDGLIGLVPFVGDILAGLASCIIVIAAWFRGVPYVTLARMAVNLGIEVLVGTIPFAGDAFVIAWKANRRNYKLLTRHLRQPHEHTWKDYVFFLCIAVVLFVIFAIPALFVLWVFAWLLRHA